MHRAVFLDRDGVINIKAPEGEYITSWEDFRFLPQVPQAIALLNQARFLVIVASNQRGIAKGCMSSGDLQEIHRRMLDELERDGASVSAIYYCPHDVDAFCPCRKPAPGMLLQAAQDHQIDLQTSWMIGDSDIDILAGKQAGCRTGRILGPGVDAAIDADVTAPSLIEAATAIVSTA